MEYQPLPAESLAKTEHGLIPHFATIFTGARYARQLYSDRRRGTAHDYKAPELFLSVDFRTPNNLPQSFRNQLRDVLVCTPVMRMPEFPPRIGANPRNPHQWRNQRPGSIELIAWANYGHFLVLATDPNHIGDVWLGFVPVTETFEVAA